MASARAREVSFAATAVALGALVASCRDATEIRLQNRAPDGVPRPRVHGRSACVDGECVGAAIDLGACPCGFCTEPDAGH